MQRRPAGAGRRSSGWWCLGRDYAHTFAWTRMNITRDSERKDATNSSKDSSSSTGDFSNARGTGLWFLSLDFGFWVLVAFLGVEDKKAGGGGQGRWLASRILRLYRHNKQPLARPRELPTHLGTSSSVLCTPIFSAVGWTCGNLMPCKWELPLPCGWNECSPRARAKAARMWAC